MRPLDKIDIFHYRDYSKHEVDIILEGPGENLVAIEVKSAQSLSHSDFKNLRYFKESYPEKFVHGIVLYSGNDILPFGSGFTACPISLLWD